MILKKYKLIIVLVFIFIILTIASLLETAAYSYIDLNSGMKKYEKYVVSVCVVREIYETSFSKVLLKYGIVKTSQPDWIKVRGFYSHLVPKLPPKGNAGYGSINFLCQKITDSVEKNTFSNEKKIEILFETFEYFQQLDEKSLLELHNQYSDKKIEYKDLKVFKL